MMISTILLFLVSLCHGIDQDRRYGTYLGELETRHHLVSGSVYAVDHKTVYIKNFNYDGQGPDAFFYGGSTSFPSGNGFIIPDEEGTKNVLGAYRSKNIVITLPRGQSLKNLKWLSVWCRAFEINFGEIMLPKGIKYPEPQKIDGLKGIHDVSSGRIYVVDAQTLLVPKFSYDGSAPDAHFWVGKGQKAGPDGILVKDENGSGEPLKKYDEKTLVLVLPGDTTIYDINWFSVWCIAFYVDFGSISIPGNLNVPPSLKMLGIEPQTRLNCEILDEEKGFEVRWALAGNSLVTQLVAKLDDGEYMGFGLSGSPDRSRMVGGDVAIAWMEKSKGKGFAKDYFLDDKSQCAGGRGSCPDINFKPRTNNIRLLNSAIINDFNMITFRRPLKASDRYDTAISTNGSQAIIWAIGPINSKGEVSYHSKRLSGTKMIEFDRIPKWNCPVSNKSAKRHKGQRRKSGKPKAVGKPATGSWYVPPIACNEPDDGIFFAQIGPTGGEQGYSSITGHVGWGISWYINGLLIPEINVVRGKTYTFVVEGGNNPDSPAEYHPMYITDDPEGGFEFKSREQRNAVKIFAGVDFDSNDNPKPTGIGRLCEWKESPDKPASSSANFGEYQRTLSLECNEGQPGVIKWTPDENTPDLVYYQCFTHRYLGWRINVRDSCQASN